MTNNIEGKIAVITGASSGLGEAAARHLSALGATVVLGAPPRAHPGAREGADVARSEGRCAPD